MVNKAIKWLVMGERGRAVRVGNSMGDKVPVYIWGPSGTSLRSAWYVLGECGKDGEAIGGHGRQGEWRAIGGQHTVI